MRWVLRLASSIAILVILIAPGIVAGESSQGDPVVVRSEGFEYSIRTINETDRRSYTAYPGIVGDRIYWLTIRFQSWDNDRDIVVSDMNGSIVAILENTGYLEYGPGIYGEIVLYTERGPNGQTLLSYNISSGKKEELFMNIREISFDEEKVAFLQMINESLEFYIYYPLNGTMTLNSSVFPQSNTFIMNGRWLMESVSHHPPGGFRIIDLESGEEFSEGRRLYTYISNMDIDGDRACWVERSDDCCTLYFMNLTTRTKRIMLEAENIGEVSISGDLMVWSSRWYGIDRYDLFIHHLPTGKTCEVVINYTDEYSPFIDGNRIVFLQGLNDKDDVRLLTIHSVPENAPVKEKKELERRDLMGSFYLIFASLMVILAGLIFLPDGPRSGPERQLRS